MTKAWRRSLGLPPRRKGAARASGAARAGHRLRANGGHGLAAGLASLLVVAGSMAGGLLDTVAGVVACSAAGAIAVSGCDARESLGRNFPRDSSIGAPDSTSPGAGPAIPKPREACPSMARLSGTDLTFLGRTVTVWSGPTGTTGPMVFYWHSTDAGSDEAIAALGPGTRDVVSAGGVIASFVDSNGTGTNTGNFTWYTGDFATADEVLACAHQQGLVDVTHIHSAGYSPGSCQTAAMVYARAYLASILCYSGGAMTMGSLPDPDNAPAMIGARGGVGSDIFGIDIAQNTLLLENDLKSKGSFVIDCDDGGDHIQSAGARMSGVAAPAWQFFKDHPYKIDPEPYKTLPPAFPGYCEVM